MSEAMSISRFGLFTKPRPPTGGGSPAVGAPESHWGQLPPAGSGFAGQLGDSDEVLISATLPRPSSNTDSAAAGSTGHAPTAELVARAIQSASSSAQPTDSGRAALAREADRQPAKRLCVSTAPVAGDQVVRSPFSALTCVPPPDFEPASTPTSSAKRGGVWGRSDGAVCRASIRRTDSEGGEESDNVYDGMTGAMELLLARVRTGGGGEGLQLDDLRSVYTHQRRVYLKHKKCADRAAEDMHRAADMMMMLLAYAPQSPQSPGDATVRSRSTDHMAPGTHESARSEHRQRRQMAARRSDAGAAYRTGVKASSLAANDSSGSATVTPPPHLSPPPPAQPQPNARRHSDAGPCNSAAKGQSELVCNSKAVRPFQFSTTLYNAFRRKPRGAFVCQFEGMDEPTAVAYGMDGTVQLWDPQTRQPIQALDSADLGVDFTEHLVQVTPSLLAAVTGARSTRKSPKNDGRLMFFGQRPPPGRLDAARLGSPQLWPAAPQDEPLSVVEGMMGGRADRGPGRGMMVTANARDRKVLIWSLQTSGSRVTEANVVHRMNTDHGSRVTALCYDPRHARVLSGSESGRFYVNDAETGKSASACSEDRVPGCVIGQIIMCPTSPHLAMLSCAQTDKQLRIMDLRQRQSVSWPALTLGVSTEGTQSRYQRPAWHPDGGLVFYPLRPGASDTPGDGPVAIWDTRYARCAAEAPQTYQVHKSGVWSASLVSQRGTGKCTMVTVGGDHCIGFTDLRVEPMAGYR